MFQLQVYSWLFLSLLAKLNSTDMPVPWGRLSSFRSNIRVVSSLQVYLSSRRHFVFGKVASPEE